MGKRAKTEYTHELNAPPEVVFPLLCPVREYEWLEGWTCEMIFSESGVAEENCVFRTKRAPAGLSTWYTTRHEPPARIEFVVVAADVVTRLSITLERTAHGTKLHWVRLFTGLTDEGNANVGWWTVEKDRALGEQLEYFVKTGTILQAPHLSTFRPAR
ncbi:MAG: hypothetical protein ABSH47_01635 [Bryobacteraceae bacterium]|jgi:hypothetical protein